MTEALALIDRVIEPSRRQAGQSKGDTITFKSERGTSASYRRKRLKRDRPFAAQSPKNKVGSLLR